MSEEGLIEPETELHGGRRVLAITATVLFLAVLVVTLVVDLVWPAPQITLIGQEAVAAQKARAQRDVFDGSAARWLEKELELRSRVRRTLAPWWAAALVRVAHTGSSDAIMGEDGWLFLRTRAVPPSGPTEEIIAQGLHALAAMDRRLAPQGVDLVFVPLPRKAVVCSARVPEGIQVRPELDRKVIDAFAELGLARIDLLEAWRGLAPEQLYIRQDSHWALDAQLAAADACIAARPGIVGADFDARIVPKEIPVRAGNLDFVGVPYGHAARRWLTPASEASATLEPAELVERFKAFRGPTDVALVGTSFSNNYPFPMLLAAKAQRDVLNASYPGGSFGEPLTRLMVATRVSGPPATIFYEFPLSQIWDHHAYRFLYGRTTGQFFVVTDPVGLSALLEGPDTLMHVPVEHPHGVRAADRDGLVVSSGEGLLLVRAEVEGAAGTRWRFQCDGFTFDFDWPSDGRTLHLPVVEGHAPTGDFALVGLDAGAKAARVTCAFVTDLDLARAVRGESVPERPAAATQRFANTDPVRGSGLVVRLGGPLGVRSAVVVRVRTEGGRARTWRFDGHEGGGVAGSSVVLVALGDLATEAQLEVEVESAHPVRELLLAPPHRAP